MFGLESGILLEVSRGGEEETGEGLGLAIANFLTAVLISSKVSLTRSLLEGLN